MSETQIYTSSLVLESCCNCGVRFGLDESMYSRLRRDHETFYCPSGHPQHYTGKSEAEKLRDELAEERRIKEYFMKAKQELHTQLTEKNHTIRSLKGAKTRMMNRVKNGVCPCCNRSFANLNKHFKSKHPELLTPKE